MKTRSGFVSNSSSSSFLIYGIELGMDEFIEMAEAFLGEKYEDWYDAGKGLNKKCNGISVEHPGEWDSVFVGISPRKIEDDETGAQFKQRVKDTLKEFLGNKNIKFSYHEEAWADY